MSHVLIGIFAYCASKINRAEQGTQPDDFLERQYFHGTQLDSTVRV